MKTLYKYDIDWGRGYGVEGVFISTPEALSKLFGKRIYFGEICGKHSEIEVSFTEDDFEVVSQDQEKIEWLEGLFDETISGHNPLSYYEDEYREEEEDE